MNELETRLAEAFAARADLVQPEDLRDEPLPAPVVQLWRRTSVLLAVAACLAVVAASVALLGDRDQDGPQPAEPRPTLELPADVGRDWDRVKDTPPAELDLDGDGRNEKVLFLAEPSEGYDGRLRLQTTLSSDGSSAHGIVDLDQTLSVIALEPIDADSDGDQELVIVNENAEGGGPAAAGPPPTQLLVLDLRDGLLVRAPATEPDLLWSGNLVVPGATQDYYELVHMQGFWIEDGSLFTSRSERSYPAYLMNLVIPEEYRVDVVEWRLADDGVLSPVPAETPCLIGVPEGAHPCAEGEQDILPPLAPFADERIGIGEQFSSEFPFPFTVGLEAFADVSLVVEMPDGTRINHGLELGDPRVLTLAPNLAYDGVAVVVTSGEADQPADLQVLGQVRDRMVALEEIGGVTLGSGETEDGRAFRSWLTANGALYTAQTTTSGDDGPWQVYTWALVAKGQLGAIPVEQLCFDDIADPATARRC